MVNWVKGLGMRAFLIGAIFALAGLVTASVVMAPGPAGAQGAEIVPLKIGYLDIEDDIRYIRAFVYARIPAVPRFRPVPGAQQGILDAQSTGKFLDLDFELVPFRGVDADALIAELFRQRDDEGISFFLVDAETHVIEALTEATRASRHAAAAGREGRDHLEELGPPTLPTRAANGAPGRTRGTR